MALQKTSNQKDMTEYVQMIEVNPDLMMGKPVIRGTRLTVEMILEELSSGTSIDDLASAHLRLTKDAIFAALAFAAAALKGEKSYPLAG